MAVTCAINPYGLTTVPLNSRFYMSADRQNLQTGLYRYAQRKGQKGNKMLTYEVWKGHKDGELYLVSSVERMGNVAREYDTCLASGLTLKEAMAYETSPKTRIQKTLEDMGAYMFALNILSDAEEVRISADGKTAIIKIVERDKDTGFVFYENVATIPVKRYRRLLEDKFALRIVSERKLRSDMWQQLAELGVKSDSVERRIDWIK